MGFFCCCGAPVPTCKGCPSIARTVNAFFASQDSCVDSAVYSCAWALIYQTGTIHFSSAGAGVLPYTGSFWISNSGEPFPSSIAEQKCEDYQFHGTQCASYTALAFGCVTGALQFFDYVFFQSTSYPDQPDPNPGQGCSGDTPENDVSASDATWSDATGASLNQCFPGKSSSTFFSGTPALQAAYQAAIPDGATTMQFGADPITSNIFLWWMP